MGLAISFSQNVKSFLISWETLVVIKRENLFQKYFESEQDSDKIKLKIFRILTHGGWISNLNTVYVNYWYSKGELCFNNLY